MKKTRKINDNNTSGFMGVNWSKDKKMWHAKIGYKGKRMHIGYFADIYDAYAAYLKKRKELGLKKVEGQL